MCGNTALHGEKRQSQPSGLIDVDHQRVSNRGILSLLDMKDVVSGDVDNVIDVDQNTVPDFIVPLEGASDLSR